MKNWIKENWFKIGLLVVIIIFIADAFYWFEWQPRQIIKECSAEALKRAAEASSDQDKVYEFVYKLCLRKNGI